MVIKMPIFIYCQVGGGRGIVVELSEPRKSAIVSAPASATTKLPATLL